MIRNFSDSDYPVESTKDLVQKSRDNTIVCRCLLGISFHTLRKMEQTLVANGFPKENVTAIMILYSNRKVKVRSTVTFTPIIMLYQNTKAMVHSPDGDTNFFNIVAGVL